MDDDDDEEDDDLEAAAAGALGLEALEETVDGVFE